MFNLLLLELHENVQRLRNERQKTVFLAIGLNTPVNDSIVTLATDYCKTAPVARVKPTKVRWPKMSPIHWYQVCPYNIPIERNGNFQTSDPILIKPFVNVAFLHQV